MFLTTEDSNEAIDIGEMVATPPGSQATACCSKDYAGTWEDLSFPSCWNSTFRLYRIDGFGTPLTKTQPAGARSGVSSRAKNKPLLYRQAEVEGNRSGC